VKRTEVEFPLRIARDVAISNLPNIYIAYMCHVNNLYSFAPKKALAANLMKSPYTLVAVAVAFAFAFTLVLFYI